MGCCSLQARANAAWAFATGAQSEASLFRALARAAEQCMQSMTAQALANVAWALATLDQSSVPLFRSGVLARAAERLVNDFNAQLLGNTS